MRILHVIYDSPDNPWLGGGGATRTLEIYKRIVAQEHRVVVLCGSYPGAPRRQSRDGLVYRYVGNGASYRLSRLSFVPSAARYIARGGYDLAVEDVSPYSPVGVPLWKPRGVPAIASVQNLSGSHAVSKYGALGWAPRLVEQPLLRLFRDFVTVSPGTAGELRNLLGGRQARIEVVPNSFDATFFRVQPAEQPDSVLFLGRLDLYQKGLDRLIAALSTVAEQGPKLRLVIAGGGSQEQTRAVARMVSESPYSDRIELLGQVSPERAAELMAEALCLVMPSRYEAWPLTALEAGAAGLPVVGSNITGVKDAAPAFPKGHGFLVPEGDIQRLAETIIKLAGDSALRRQAGARGKAWAARFTWDNLAEQQLRFYMDVLQTHKEGKAR